MQPVDTFLAIASKGDTRRYADRPIPDETIQRILDAGRLAGSEAFAALTVRIFASPIVREPVARPELVAIWWKCDTVATLVAHTALA
jgi:nitroreductase